MEAGLVEAEALSCAGMLDRGAWIAGGMALYLGLVLPLAILVGRRLARQSSPEPEG